MRDSAEPAEIPSRSPARSARHSPSTTHPSPSTTHPSSDRSLGDWLEAQREFLAIYWFDEILHRVSMEPEMERILERFLILLTCMIPGALDHRRSVVDPVWKRAAELYGTLGAQRGLAAGDIVEEFQIVREAVLRILFQAPPKRYGTALDLRIAPIRAELD